MCIHFVAVTFFGLFFSFLCTIDNTDAAVEQCNICICVYMYTYMYILLGRDSSNLFSAFDHSVNKWRSVVDSMECSSVLFTSYIFVMQLAFRLPLRYRYIKCSATHDIIFFSFKIFSYFLFFFYSWKTIYCLFRISVCIWLFFFYFGFVCCY